MPLRVVRAVALSIRDDDEGVELFQLEGLCAELLRVRFGRERGDEGETKAVAYYALAVLLLVLAEHFAQRLDARARALAVWRAESVMGF